MKNMSENEIVKKYDALARKLAYKAFENKKHLLDTRFMDFDDILQFAYMGVIDAYRSFKEDAGANFMTYAWTCVIHRIDREAFSTKKVNTFMRLGDMSLDATITSDTENELNELVGEEDISLLDTEYNDLQKRLLGRLSAKDRDILTLNKAYGWTYREIANKYKVSHTYIGTKIEEILQQLKIQYMRECKKYV